MNAFELDRRVTIQTRTDAKNGSGEVIAAWSTLATVWAKRVPLRGAELYATNQVVAQAECKLRIRWRSDVTEKMRILDDGVTYGIQHIADPAMVDGKLARRHWLDLTIRRPE